MFRTALKIYKKNIWEVFALMGFVSIGVFVGLFIIIPAISGLISSTYDTIVKAAQSVSIDNFNVNAFINSLTEQLTKLDWANPIITLQNLFNVENPNNLQVIIVNGLNAAGLGPMQIELIMDEISAAIGNLSSGISSQWTIFLSCIGTGAAVGYLLTKLVVYFKSAENKNAIKFILTFILNSLSFALSFYLINKCITSLTGVGKFFALLGVFIALLILTFGIAMLFYKPKNVKRREVFNLKTTLALLVAGLAIFAISYALIAVVYIFSDLVALVIAYPVLIITSIILENIVLAYVSDYENIKNTPRKTFKKKSAAPKEA